MQGLQLNSPDIPQPFALRLIGAVTNVLIPLSLCSVLVSEMLPAAEGTNLYLLLQTSSVADKTCSAGSAAEQSRC